MSERVLLVEKDAGIATVTLNRPQALNALSRDLREAIQRAFVELKGDPSTEVVILTGAGRAFCAGLDLKELGSPEHSQLALGAASERDMVDAVVAFDRPVIAGVNGVAITGGFELALACDFMIASTEARFADTHARVGIIPGWGMTQRLPRLIGSARAKELSFTGNFLSAEQAEAWGLVNRVVPAEQLLPTCLQLAREIQSCVPEVVRGIKALVDHGMRETLTEGLRAESEASKAHNESVTPEMVEERRRRIQQRGRAQTA